FCAIHVTSFQSLFIFSLLSPPPSSTLFPYTTLFRSLVFKGTKLEPADVAELKERFGARWVNWFPDDPHELGVSLALGPAYDTPRDRKSTRLNSSHVAISYAVFCLKKKINSQHNGPDN